MAEIDGSIAANIGKGPANDLFGRIGQLATVQNQVNENRLFQGRQAAGQAVQQSVGPDGQIDYGRAASLVSQNKLIAPYALQALGELQNQRGQQITNTTNQTTLQSTYTKNLTADIAGQDPSAIPGIIFRGVATGRYPQAVGEQFLGGGMEAGGKTFGQHAADLAKQTAIQSGSETAMEAAFGKPEVANIGGANVETNVNRVTGQRNVMGGGASIIANTQTPEAMGTLVTTTDAHGVTHAVPKSVIETPEGQPRPNVAGLTGAHGEITTGLAPGEAEAISGPKVAQAGQAAELGKVYEGSVPRAAQLKELLAAQGDFLSGPGAAKWSGIVTEFNRLFNTNLASDQVAAQQTFGKIAEQVAEMQRGAMGSNATNAQTEAARIASPNTAYSPEANRRVIGMLLGNEDYIQTKQKAWQAFQAHGGKPGQYNAFVQQFNAHFDPRYFQEQYMTAAQKAEMRKSMSPTEAKKYDAGKAVALSLDFGQ